MDFVELIDCGSLFTLVEVNEEARIYVGTEYGQERSQKGTIPFMILINIMIYSTLNIITAYCFMFSINSI